MSGLERSLEMAALNTAPIMQQVANLRLLVSECIQERREFRILRKKGIGRGD